MSIIQVLSTRIDSMNGRRITIQESNELIKIFDKQIPAWFMKILLEFPITECDFCISEELDESELGVLMKSMSPKQIISESTECYPGKAAKNFNYIPFGICLEGSGDYYYIKFSRNNASLVRIPHTAVGRNQELIEQDVEIVSSQLSNFFRLAEL